MKQFIVSSLLSSFDLYLIKFIISMLQFICYAKDLTYS